MLPLNLVLETEVELKWFVRFAVAKDGPRFSRVMVAIVKEEHNGAPDLQLQPPRRLDLRNQEALRIEPARLLPEADDGFLHDANPLRRLRIDCKPPAQARH